MLVRILRTANCLVSSITGITHLFRDQHLFLNVKSSEKFTKQIQHFRFVLLLNIEHPVDPLRVRSYFLIFFFFFLSL